jgi:hypothetical protein
MRGDAKWCSTCSVQIMLERKRAFNRARSAAGKRRRYPNAQKSLNPHQNIVSSRHDPNPRQKFCLVCCGMPWARSPQRFQEGRPGHEEAVAGDAWLCKGCGEAWAPEPAPEPLSLLGSSAGLAVSSGELYGMKSEKTGRKRKGEA